MYIIEESADLVEKSFKLREQETSSASLKCLMWNVTSMIRKTPRIMEQLIDEEPDLVFIQETWLKSSKNNVTSITKDYGYLLVHNIRKNRERERSEVELVY